MRKAAIVLALTALVTSGYAGKSYAAEFEDLVSGNKMPLNLQFKDMNDNSWRQIAVSGQFEMGDLLKNWANLFGNIGYTNVYYTQGKTVGVGAETYLIAYRLVYNGEPLTFTTLVQSTFNTNNCSPSSLPTKITPETSLNLSLLNLKTIGSLNDIRPFKLQEEIAASEANYQKVAAACEQARVEEINSKVSSQLQSIWYGLSTYTQSNDGKLPSMKTTAEVQDALASYITDPTIFVHPTSGENYLPNTSLSSKKVETITNPEEIVIFYEASPAKDGTRAVVYVSGTVLRLPEVDWQQAKKKSGIR
jgi:hypothetical protein